MRLSLFIRKIILINFFIGLCVNLFSQTGTSFWVATPYTTPSHDWGHSIHIVVSSMASPSTVTLSIPSNKSFTPVTINLSPNSTDYFDFNSTTLNMVECSEWNQVTNKGILIESSDIITAYLEIFSTSNTDIIALKAKNALGTDFYTPFQTTWNNHDFSCSATNPGCIQAYSHIEIIATEDNTTVWITPTTDLYKDSTSTHPAGIPYSVTLNKGQTYAVRSVSIAASDRPAGTHITSDKPIAINSTDDSMEISGAFDTNADQLIPVNISGSQYIAMKGYLNDEYVYGVATENNTKFSINGIPRSKTYNKGDTLIIKLTSNSTLIQSDNKQKFTLLHVSGNSNETGAAILPPTDQCSGSLQVGFNFGHAETGSYLYLNLMVRAGAESNFLVDGTSASWLTPASFTTIAGTSWSVARFSLTNVELTEGNHIISNTKDIFHLGYINYTGPGSLYGYFSDFEKLEVAAIAIKSNTDTAIACTGEPLQLRVDGGVNYNWTGKNVTTNADASMYLSNRNIYNPIVSGSIPQGNYIFTVNVSSACNGPVVSKSVKVKVVQSPSPQVKSASVCESEVGSGCASNINLMTNYTNLMTNNWPGAVIQQWQKDGYNEQITLDDFDGTRVVKYGANNASFINIASPNPKINWKNPSTTVLRFQTPQNSTSGFFTLNEHQDFPFSTTNGTIFTMKIMNVVNFNWSESYGFRSVTMTLSNDTSSVSLTVVLSKFNEWEDITFDFSSKTLADYNNIEISFNGKNINSSSEDVFYLDDLKKQYSYRKITLTDPSDINVCNGEKVYAYFEDPNGCSANSTLTMNISGGNFSVNNPTIKLCQTGSLAGEASSVDFNSFTSQIIAAPTTGKSIMKWEFTKSNYDSVYENFDNVASFLTWNKLTTDQSGTSITLNETYPNPNINTTNNSPTAGFISNVNCNWADLTVDLVNPIDLSVGSVFKLMASYREIMNPNSKDKTILMELSGGGNTAITATIATLTKPSLSVNTWSDWNDFTFDFSAYSTLKGFDKIRFRFTPNNWGSVQFMIDNLRRIMKPFTATSIDVSNMTVNNNDKAWAIVQDANGCKVKSTITFSVSDCGPPAIDQTDTLCEATLGSGNVSGIDLTTFNNKIKGNVSANTVTWFSNPNLTSSVATPANITASNGQFFYALVKDPVKGKQDTATIKFIINPLPNIVFPTLNSICEGTPSFTISGITPIGGAWSGGTYISSSGVFDPANASLGSNTIRYSVTINGCSSTKDSNIVIKPYPNPTLITSAQDLKYCGTAGVSVSVSNISGATYSWSKNKTAITGTTNKLNALTSGTYSVTVDLNGCKKTIDDIIVVGHEIPEYSITGGGKFCNDTTALPDITITLAKGDLPWNIFYNNGSEKWSETNLNTSTFTIPKTNLKSGTYQLDSLTNTYCKAIVSTTKNVVLTEIKRPKTTLQTTDLTYCGTNSDIVLTVDPFTPASYEWKRGGTIVGNNSNFINNAVAGIYSVTLTNDICKYSVNDITVTQYNKPTYNFTGGGIFCQEKPIDQVVLNLTGDKPWNVTYRIDGKEYTETVTNSPFLIPQIVAGDYDIKSIADNNSCIADANTGTNGSANITINPKPAVTFSYLDSICENTSSVDISGKVSPTSGGTGIFTGIGVNKGGLFTHSGIGIYVLTYTFTDTKGCIDSAKRSINVNRNPITNITPDPASTCVNTDLILHGNPSKGQPPYIHLWTDPSNISISSKNSEGLTINTANQNTYSITYNVTDKNGCQSSKTITVTANGLPTVTAKSSPAAICLGGGSTISSDGANSYEWSSGQTSTNFSVSPTASTSYSVTGTDINGCKNTAQTAVTVNGIPTINVSVPALDISSGNYCVSNSSPLAITTTSNPGGGTVTLSGFGVSGTSFTPSVAGTGSYTITMNYTDLNGCKNNATTTATVTALPTVNWASANPSLVCSDGAIVPLNVDVQPGTVGGTGSFVTFTGLSKANESSATLDPVVAGAGTKALNYEFTDKNGCKASATSSIEVYDTPEPKVINISTISTPLPQPGTFIFDVTDQSLKDVKWYNSPMTAIVLGTGNTYEPSIPHTNTNPDSLIAKCYDYLYTQTIHGCESQPTQAQSCVTNCPAKAPEPNPVANPCTAANLSTILGAKTTGGGTGPIHWFNGSDTKNANDIHTGNTYTVIETIPKTYTYYVAEYDVVNNCFSPTTPVSFTINPLPTPVILSTNTKICYDQNPVSINTNNGLPVGPLPKGTLIGKGISGSMFDPKMAITDTTITNSTLSIIAYTYTDINNCTDSTTISMSINFTKRPNTTDAKYLISQIENGIIPELQAKGDNSSTIKWYIDSTKTFTICSGEILNTNIKTITPQSGTDYWATQTVNGCESEPTNANIKVVSCPTPAPLVKNITACENDSIPFLSAQGTKLNWYDSSHSTEAITNEGSIDYNPKKTLPGIYTYYVSQKLIDPTTLQECEGPREQITLKINPKPQISITNKTTHLCIDAVPIQITTKSDVTGSGIFYGYNLTNINNSKADFDAKLFGVGMHEIKYVFTDLNNCKDSLTQTIKVDSTPPPFIKPLFEDMVHNPVPELSALGDSIKWYSSQNLNNQIGDGSPFIDKSISENTVITKDFWVTQTKNGCESMASKTQIQIRSCPVPSPDLDRNNFKICNYDSDPCINTTSGVNWPLPASHRNKFLWYIDQNGDSPIHQGSSFCPSIQNKTGIQTYYVGEYDSLYTCMSPLSKLSFSIITVPSPDVIPVDDICSGEQNKTLKIDNPYDGQKYIWYSSQDTTHSRITNGQNYTPVLTTAGKYTYWISRMDENNCHSPATQTSVVIKPRPSFANVKNEESCKGEKINTLTATGEQESVFEWYKDDTLHYAATSPTLIPEINKTTIYFVRQNLNNCRGWFMPDTYTIKPIPISPIVSDKEICINHDLPTFIAEATGTVNWYNQSNEFIANGISLTPEHKNSTDYFVTQTIKGCESEKKQVHLEIHPLPQMPLVTDKMRKCEQNGSQSVTVNSGSNLRWYSTSDTTENPLRIGGNTFVFIDKPYGEYHIYITQTDKYSCQSEPFDAKVYVDSLPNKPIINESTVEICEYDQIPTLSVNNNNQVLWYNDQMKFIQSGSVFNPTKTQLKTNEYAYFIVKVKSSQNCESEPSEKVGIKIKATPSIPVPLTKDFCIGDSAKIIFAHKSQQYTITDDSFVNQWITDSILTLPKEVTDSSGNRKYLAFQTINGCNSNKTAFEFNVLEKPKPVIIGKDSLCPGSFGVPYSVIDKNKNDTFKWSITGNRVQYKSGETTQNYTRMADFIEPGIDTLFVEENNGHCSGKSMIEIKIAPLPEPDFQWEIPGGLTKVNFTNKTIQPDIPTNRGDIHVDLKMFKWNFGRENDLKDSIIMATKNTETKQIKIYYQYGYYDTKLVAVNSFGCSDSITKNIFVDLCEGLFLPNCFMPANESPELNCFRPKGFNLDTYEIWIYDVWGNLLWYSNKLLNGSPAEGWDGKYNGEILKMDSYIWKVKAVFKDGTEFGSKHLNDYSKFGNVLLLR